MRSLGRCTSPLLLALLATGWIGLAGAGALQAQTAEEIADAIVASQNPAAIHTFEIEGGHEYVFDDRGKDNNYYRISYLGSLIDAKGTPFKDAQGLDLTVPVLSTTGVGDRNDLSLRYEKGKATIGGEIFELAGAQPLTLRGLESLHLRGTALVGSDLEAKKVQIAVGLESPPLRLPGFKNTHASNWLVLGVNAQRQEQIDSSTEDANFGLATYRAFLGQAFGWRPSADVTKTAAQLARTILSQAPDLDTAKKKAVEINKIQANQRTAPQQLLLDAIPETGSPDLWEQTVQDLALGHTEAILDQPTFSIYAEASGWYQFSGGANIAGNRQVKNLVTVTFDYWPLTQNDAVFLRARYENGYERAAPDVKKNHLLLSIALRF